MNEIQKNVHSQNNRPSVSISFDFETSAQFAAPLFRIRVKNKFINHPVKPYTMMKFIKDEINR